jgi:hypothetical protein
MRKELRATTADDLAATRINSRVAVSLDAARGPEGCIDTLCACPFAQGND